MVKTSQSIKGKPDAVSAIERIRYRPPAAYLLDLEVLAVQELRRRVDHAEQRAAHRVEFYLLICVSAGRCTHTIDFAPVDAKAGSVLLIRPGQAQRFDLKSDWDGWLLIFRPEFLLPRQASAALSDVQMVDVLASLPACHPIGRAPFAAMLATIAQIRADVQASGGAAELQGLLRHQLCALLLRHAMSCRSADGAQAAAPASWQRFKRFEQLLEKQFPHWHAVGDYASQLGCSERSLTRSVAEIAGQSAKALIMARINLEAKRLLAHTTLPVAAIADQLGFDEVTNFVKFFRREAGCPPGEFRQRALSLNLSAQAPEPRAVPRRTPRR